MYFFIPLLKREDLLFQSFLSCTFTTCKYYPTNTRSLIAKKRQRELFTLQNTSTMVSKSNLDTYFYSVLIGKQEEEEKERNVNWPLPIYWHIRWD